MIHLDKTEPPVGHVDSGGIRTAFSGWLELFHILDGVARPGEGTTPISAQRQRHP